MSNTPSDAEIKDLYAEQTGFILDDSPAALLDFARAVLAKWGRPAGAVEPQPSAEGPPEVWLQLHCDCLPHERTEPVDYTSDDVTWCWHAIHSDDVRYVRADLAATPQPTKAQAGSVPLTDEQIEALPMWKRFVGLWPETRREIVRTIERQHGIKGDTP